jgi:tRNA modification GTPase
MPEQTLDTIVAPATPIGRSALAVIRIDGPRSASILQALSPDVVFAERMATHTTLRRNGDPLDDCVAIVYRAPRSFTGNDLVEMSLHGSPVVVDRVLESCVALGARVAEPGEFTERAVLNGKIDLIQAEAIGDLIASRTALQARLSLVNLSGSLSATAMSVREDLLGVIARLEAALDFSEEGYDFITGDAASAVIRSAITRIDEMAATYVRGRPTSTGLTAVILGRPNAGKSTLLNRLVGSERAIVTPEPGTTRDLLRETIDVGGLPVTLVDTAGLRQSSDPIEQIGMGRARAAAEKAELILYLVDASAGLTAEDARELQKVRDPLIIYGKIDLAAGPAGELGISATSGEGIPLLLSRLDRLVRERYAVPEGSSAVVNRRQEGALRVTAEALREAECALGSNSGSEIVLVDLYRAANALGLLVGAISNDDVLREIFSKFCIGK